MHKTLFGILVAVSLYGCDQRAQIDYHLESHVEADPTDTLTQGKIARFITETTRAASQHMTGGDYEDPEDVIEQAQESAERLYLRPQLVLVLEDSRKASLQKYGPWELGPADQRMYDSLRVLPLGTIRTRYER